MKENSFNGMPDEFFEDMVDNRFSTLSIFRRGLEVYLSFVKMENEDLIKRMETIEDIVNLKSLYDERVNEIELLNTILFDMEVWNKVAKFSRALSDDITNEQYKILRNATSDLEF